MPGSSIRVAGASIDQCPDPLGFSLEDLTWDSPVLILDEPTSALDALTEDAVVQATGRLMQGRTTLIIAHRLSTVRHADRIVVLHQGKVAEQGTHQQLIQLGGRYADMVDKQRLFR